MRYTPNDKYTIAWFKLAECVAKGEKEKAFGVYRLLKHSFDDQAYAHQLEGDLLDAFQDSRAVEKYAEAAHLYRQNGRLKEAAKLYYDLIFLAAHDMAYITKWLELHNGNKNKELTVKKLSLLAQELMQKAMVGHLNIVITSFDSTGAASEVAKIYQSILLSCLKNADGATNDKELLLKTVLDFYLQQTQQQELQELLSHLKEGEPSWHARALAILNS